MKHIAIVNDIFDEFWIKKAEFFVSVQQRAAVWTTNQIYFPKHLSSGAGTIMINVLPAPFDSELEEYLIDRNILKSKCKFFSGSLYLGQPGSYIPWHTDGKADFTSTSRAGLSIYLNRTWDSSWGGWFSYKDNINSEIKSYSPKFNTAIALLSDVEHCTTPISPTALVPRISFQLFFDRESLNDTFFN